jgi:hypothetical protein
MKAKTCRILSLYYKYIHDCCIYPIIGTIVIYLY